MTQPVTTRPRGPKARLASLWDTLRAKGWEPGQATSWEGEDLEQNYTLLLQSGTKWKNLPLACVAVELLAQHQPDTVRGNMYLVVSAGWLPDTGDKSYDRIQRLLNRLRENGTVPFAWVVDNVRQTIKPSSRSGLHDFADTVKEAYRKDFWAELPDYVEVIVEKDTIAGKLAPVTREFDVPLHPIRGYSSTSYAYGIARGWRDITKPIAVYYLGDHDPSGRDLERNIREKLARYSKREFAWVRLGVNPEHFAQHDIIPLEPKKKDSRYQKFVAEWGERCAEVEAIPATALRDMVREAIKSHIPAGEWQRLQRVEELERGQWDRFMGRLRGWKKNGD
jgi:hypothetical protein